MTYIPFAFQFDGKHYSGMFEKIPAVGTETPRFRIFDIDPNDLQIPQPFYLYKNYDNDGYSFKSQDDNFSEFLHKLTSEVLIECESQGIDIR